MSKVIYILIPLVCLASFSCSKNESTKDVKVMPVERTEVSKRAAVDSAKKTKIDTIADNKATIADNKRKTSSRKERKYIPPEPPKPYKVSLTLPQVEILNNGFYHVLDSLNTLEMKCMGSEVKRFNLHWVINSWSNEVLELTMESGIGKGYKGYFYINDMLFLLTTNQPQFFRPTSSKKEFVFKGINHIMTEDYSVYLFKEEGSKVILTEKYNLPCN